LAAPFRQNGRHYLVLRQGIDGNVLEGDCGSFLSAFDTVYVDVNDCYRYSLPVDMRNVSVDADDERLWLHWSFPDTLRPSVFDAYSLEYQENTGGNWVEWGRFENMSDTQTVVTAHVPDLFSRDFRVKLQLKNGLQVQAGRPLGNILLENEDGKLQLVTERLATLSWTNYSRAWQPQRYFLVVRGPKGIDSLALNEDDTLYTYEKSLVPGAYQVEVRTLSADGRWARSNALDFEVSLPDVTVFNVITPNGDGKNDVLKAENLEFYPDNQLRVFNRWGQMVYEKQAYQNDWSPSTLEGGNYQYELRLNEQQVLRGSLRIVK
jgi:gliding motility-associated-like protein